MSFQGNIFSFMAVFTYEHVALLLIFLAFFRPLCSPCWHIYVCVYLGKRKMEGGRERGVHARACVWAQPSPYNYIAKIRRLKKVKAHFNIERI